MLQLLSQLAVSLLAKFRSPSQNPALDRSFAWAQVFAPAPIINRDLGRDPPGDFGRSLQPSCGWDPPCACSAPPPSLAQSHTNLSLGRRSDLPHSRGGPGLRDSVEDING